MKAWNKRSEARTVMLICEVLFQIMANCKLAVFIAVIFIIHFVSSKSSQCVTDCTSVSKQCLDDCDDQLCANNCTETRENCYKECNTLRREFFSRFFDDRFNPKDDVKDNDEGFKKDFVK